MNKELDKLLCLLDGKITVYRMKHSLDYTDTPKLIAIQKEIQELWKINKGG